MRVLAHVAITTSSSQGSAGAARGFVCEAGVAGEAVGSPAHSERVWQDSCGCWAAAHCSMVGAHRAPGERLGRAQPAQRCQRSPLLGELELQPRTSQAGLCGGSSGQGS